MNTPAESSVPHPTATGKAPLLRRGADVALYFSFCFLLGSGLMLKLSFVKGRGPQTVLGAVKHSWEDWHFYAGVLMAAAVCVHVWYNRLWLRNVLCKKRPVAFWIFLGLGVALVLALALWPTEIASAGQNAAQGAGQGLGLGQGAGRP